MQDQKVTAISDALKVVPKLEDLENVVEEEKESHELKLMYITVRKASLETHVVLTAACSKVISITSVQFVLRSSSS